MKTNKTVRANKRIKKAIKRIDKFFDDQVGTPTQREYANFIADIQCYLRGKNENMDVVGAWNEQQKKIDAIKDLFKGYECGPELAAFEKKIMEIIKCGKT